MNQQLKNASVRGGLFINEGGTVPLIGVEVTGRLTGIAGDFTVTQRYRNVEKKPVEVTYLFPLPEEAAVCGFEVQLADRVLRGEVEEREKAFEKYDEAMAQGNGAALLDEERPNLFQLSIGNMLPESELVIRLRFLLMAAREGRGTRLLLPTSISPRYSPAPQTPAELAEIDRVAPPYAASVPYGMKLKLDLELSSAIRIIDSPSHKIRSEVNGDQATITFSQESASMDRDFVLYFEAAEPLALGSRLSEWHDRQYLLLELCPVIAEEETPAPRQVIFLIDCSGSMGGDSIAEARRAVELCVRALNEGDHFQIACFGTSYRFLFPEFLPFNQATLDQAVQAIQKIDADMHGTEILPALKAILGNESPGLAGQLLDKAASLLGRSSAKRQGKMAEERRSLIILTDGEVTNDDEVLAYVKESAGKTRLFSFGIGAGASEYLVKGLARQSNGAAEFIFPGERIEPKVLRQFGRIDTPAIEEVKIDWGGLEVEAAPASIPPVFASEPLLIAGRLKASAKVPRGAKVTLSGKINGRQQSWETHVKKADSGEISALWWARQAIRDLEEGVSGVKGSNQKRGRETRLVKLAKEYGLLCRETSWIAIEERPADKKSTTLAELRKVPVLVTNGWHGGQSGVARGAQSTIMGFMAGVKSMTGGGIFDAVFSAVQPSAPMEGKTRARLSQSACCDESDGFAAPPCPAPRAAKLSVKESEYDAGLWYLELLQQQKADGSFRLTPLLEKVSGKPLTELKHWASLVAVADQGQVEDILATGLAVVLLRLKAKDDEPSWKKAAQKARAWLKKTGAQGENGADLLDWLTSRLP